MEVCDWKNTKCSKEILSFVWYCRSFSFIVSTHASSLYAGTPSIADFEVYKPWLHFSNIAMENCPFVDYLPIKHRDFQLCFVYWRVPIVFGEIWVSKRLLQYLWT